MVLQKVIGGLRVLHGRLGVRRHFVLIRVVEARVILKMGFVKKLWLITPREL